MPTTLALHVVNSISTRDVLVRPDIHTGVGDVDAVDADGPNRPVIRGIERASTVETHLSRRRLIEQIDRRVDAAPHRVVLHEKEIRVGVDLFQQWRRAAQSKSVMVGEHCGVYRGSQQLHPVRQDAETPIGLPSAATPRGGTF